MVSIQSSNVAFNGRLSGQTKKAIKTALKEFSQNEKLAKKTANKSTKYLSAAAIPAGIFGFIKNISYKNLAAEGTKTLKNIFANGIPSNISPAGLKLLQEQAALVNAPTVTKAFTLQNLTINPLGGVSLLAAGIGNSIDRFIHNKALKTVKPFVEHLMTKGFKGEELVYGVKKFMGRKGSLIRSNLFKTFRPGKVRDLANLKDVKPSMSIVQHLFNGVKGIFTKKAA